jgi:hypothetical protein
MALLVGGFGWQFAVTNPLIATRLFHLGSAGFGLFGTCAAVGGIGANYAQEEPVAAGHDPGYPLRSVKLIFRSAECMII